MDAFLPRLWPTWNRNWPDFLPSSQTWPPHPTGPNPTRAGLHPRHQICSPVGPPSAASSLWCRAHLYPAFIHRHHTASTRRPRPVIIRHQPFNTRHHPIFTRRCLLAFFCHRLHHPAPTSRCYPVSIGRRLIATSPSRRLRHPLPPAAFTPLPPVAATPLPSTAAPFTPLPPASTRLPPATALPPSAVATPLSFAAATSTLLPSGDTGTLLLPAASTRYLLPPPLPPAVSDASPPSVTLLAPPRTHVPYSGPGGAPGVVLQVLGPP